MKIEEGKYYKTRDGRKVGPMVPVKSKWNIFSADMNGVYNEWYFDGRQRCDAIMSHDLIAEWQDGPIREVTKKELVPGVYGRFKIDTIPATGWIRVGIDRSHLDTGETKFGTTMHSMCVKDLRDAAKLFTELANYLEEK